MSKYSARPYSVLFATVFLAVLPLFVGCKKSAVSPPSPEQVAVQQEMLDAYKVATRLYDFVWTPSRFQDDTNSGKITALLDRLLQDFHRVEEVTKKLAAEDATGRFSEPGFRLALDMNREMLRDARNRFSSGAKDYANWRLRGMVTNCIACHSRYEVPVDFVGKGPPKDDESFESQLAAAEFQFATRQFDAAADSLFKLATLSATTPEGAHGAFRALQEWLVIQVRVKNRPAEAAQKLSEISSHGNFQAQQKRSINSWKKQLDAVSKRQFRREDPILAAAGFLHGALETASLETDEENLVNTLYASAMLHRLLQGDSIARNITETQRRKATFLLALAYSHIPIPLFEVYREQYLEQTIREFPSSTEAQNAFLLLQDIIEQNNSGSGGLHLDSETQQKLRILRLLAFGSPSPS